MAATIDDYRWLVSDAAAPWLTIARNARAGYRGLRSKAQPGAAAVQLLTRLRKDLSAERAHLIIEQLELRQRAREKFSWADKMYFTRKGLEQATDERLASYKASRFAGSDPITDVCCGIGGDLIAFAVRGATLGVDRDPIMALLARANAAVHGYDERRCNVFEQEVADRFIRGGLWHCDPDRRPTGQRTTRSELFSPPLATLDRLLAQNNRAAIKLAPATEAPADWKDVAELEWLSSRGECRQQVAWFGSLVRDPGRRAATVVSPTGANRTIVGEPSEDVPPATNIGSYIYEPDAAVLAAKLVGALGRQHGLAAISPGIAYLTSDQRIDDLALAGFEVVDMLPFDRKRLKAYCREHAIGRLEIKKRGVDADPERLRKEIGSSGDGQATIIVSPVGGKVSAIVAHRLGA